MLLDSVGAAIDSLEEGSLCGVAWLFHPSWRDSLPLASPYLIRYLIACLIKRTDWGVRHGKRANAGGLRHLDDGRSDRMRDNGERDKPA